MNRLEAWKKASELVEPIVEKHGLEKYSPGSNIFVTGIDMMTPVDQHIETIMLVANWLLDDQGN